MKTLIIKRQKLDLARYIKHTALEGDCKNFITEPVVIVDEDTKQPKIIYDVLEGFDTGRIVEALRRIKYHEGKRARGLTSTSRIFGYRPRSEIRGDFCSSTSLAREYPSEHALVTSLAVKLEDYYKRYDQQMFSKHKQTTEGKVKKAYRMDGASVFTSGIINKNNPLKYHYDTGNFTDVYSCMIVFKGQGVEGGHLNVPEYDARFELPNNSIFFFDGQGIVHGVTPIIKTQPESYRFSMVYYSLKRMWQCLEVDDELMRLKQRKTVRERTRMNNPLTEEDRALKAKNIKMLQDRWGKQ